MVQIRQRGEIMIHKGFTLIEVLVTVAIIGILATIAYPSYQDYVKKTNRVDVQSEMLLIYRELENYKSAKGTYANAKLKNGTFTESYPLTGESQYTIKLDIASNNFSWTLTASPTTAGMQVGNGDIVLNSKGYKCWIKATTCIPAPNTDWTGS